MCWRLKRANKTTTDKVLARFGEHCVHTERPREVSVTPEQWDAGAEPGPDMSCLHLQGKLFNCNKKNNNGVSICLICSWISQKWYMLNCLSFCYPQHEKNRVMVLSFAKYLLTYFFMIMFWLCIAFLASVVVLTPFPVFYICLYFLITIFQFLCFFSRFWLLVYIFWLLC